MRRRDFIGVVVGATGWPVLANAQQPERVRRLGGPLAARAQQPRLPVIGFLPRRAPRHSRIAAGPVGTLPPWADNPLLMPGLVDKHQQIARHYHHGPHPPHRGGHGQTGSARREYRATGPRHKRNR
jgi:hypothetical protein